MYKKKIQDVVELRERVVEEWKRLDQSVIDSAVTECHGRLRACMKARGRHFEHKP